MDLRDGAADDRRTLAKAIVVALIVAMFAPVTAYAITTVKAKIKDSEGDFINSQVVPAMGSFSAPGSTGAIDVSTFAGGGGAHGVGDCDTATDGAGITSSVTVPSDASGDTIVTGILLTGAGAKVEVTVPAIFSSYKLAEIEATSANPTVFVGLGNGLSINAAPMTFTCAPTGASNPGKFVVFGQG